MKKLISGVFHLVGVLIFSALLLLGGVAAGAGGLLYLAYEHDPKIASKVDRTVEIFEDAIEKSEAVWSEEGTSEAAFEVQAFETITVGEPRDTVVVEDGRIEVSETVVVPVEVQVENAIEEVSVETAGPKTDSTIKMIEKAD